MDDFITSYIESIKSKNLSQNTIIAYSNDIKKFCRFIKDRNEEFKELSVISIMAYVQRLQKDGMAQSSIIRSLNCLKNICKYGIKLGILKEDPFLYYEIPKGTYGFPEILTLEEVNRLLSVQDLNSNKGIRDKAMLELMYATGLKVNELLSITIFDINIKLSYLKCKGFKENERVIPFGSYSKNCLVKYLKIRNKINTHEYNYLFLNSKGDKMTRQGFWKIIKYYANRADINKDINLYTLRHSFAVHLLENGADVKSVQELLGNNSIYSIQRYGAISKKNRLAEVYKNTHPRA